MLVQEKNIKGFNVLELIVVLTIVGIISAVAYPNFSEWTKERQVRAGATKVKSFMKNIHSQTEKGMFAYVQVIFNNNDDRLQLTSKGMTMQDLASLINNVNSDWNQLPEGRCDMLADNYWSTDNADDDDDIRNFVYTISLEDVTTNFIGDGAVCFARNGKFFEASSNFDSGNSVPFQYVYVCRRASAPAGVCPVPNGDAVTKEEALELITHLRAVNFGRFGNFSTSKFKSDVDDGGNYTGGTWME